MTAKKLRRSVAVDAPDFIEEKDERIIELAFSSEAPYTRYYMNQDGEQVELKEILVHDESAVDLSVLNETNASLLFNHNLDLHIGKIVPGSARIDEDRIGRCLVQFSKVGQLANECFEKVKEGTLSQVSVGYNVLDGKADFNKGIYYVTRWQPFECSLVTCAADPFNAGVGRSLNTDNEMIVLEGEQVEDEIKDTPVEEIKPEDEEKRSEEEKEEQENEEIDSDSGNSADSGEDVEEPQEVTPEEKEERSEDEPEETEELNKDTDENDETENTSEPVEEEKIEDEEKPFERSREDTAEIRAIGKHLNISEDVIEAAIKDSAVTIENFKEKARALNTTESKQFSKSKGDNMENALKKYDLGRAIRSQVTGKALDGLEAEVHQELAREAAQRGRAQREGSIFIPASAMRAGQTVATQKPINPEELRSDSFVDLLLEGSILGKLGVQKFTGLTAPIAIPRLSSRNIENFGFVNEGVAGSEDNGMTFDSVKMNMATYTGGIPLTRQAIINMPSIGDLVATQLLRASRIQLEKAILGGGTVKNAKDSIIKQLEDASKVKTMDLTHANFVKAVAELADKGCDPSALKFAMTHGMGATLQTTLKDAGIANGYIMTDGKIAGRPVFESGVMAADKILFGDFSGIAVAEWGNGLELDIDTTSHRNTGSVVLRLFSELDYSIIDNQALAVIKAGE
ncbi:TPA: phage major capsid protein [Escherichia coli]